MQYLRLTNIFMSLVLFTFDFVLFYDFKASGTYNWMTGNLETPMTSPVPNSLLLAMIFGFIIFGAIQCRLEVQNYKYGEGFLMKLKKWWNDSHQDEVNENEEYGINSMRLLTIFVSLKYCITSPS